MPGVFYWFFIDYQKMIVIFTGAPMDAPAESARRRSEEHQVHQSSVLQ